MSGAEINFLKDDGICGITGNPCNFAEHTLKVRVPIIRTIGTGKVGFLEGANSLFLTHSCAKHQLALFQNLDPIFTYDKNELPHLADFLKYISEEQADIPGG